MDRKRVVVALVLLLLLTGIVWATRSRRDPQLARVKEMGDQLRGDNAQNLSPEERREQWGHYRQEVEKLTPEQQSALRKEREQAFMKREKERLDQFFALPPAQQLAQLDADIDRTEKLVKEFQARRQANPTGSGSGPNSSSTSRSSDPDAREKRRKEFLDSTSPVERAKSAEYRRALSQRRQQRGLPPPTGAGRRG